MAVLGGSIRIEIRGTQVAIAKLKKLKGALQRRILRRAMSAALVPMRREYKRAAPKDTGTMRRFVQKKVKVYPSGRGVAIVGIKRGAKDAQTGRNPEKYLHLVLFGHRIARGGTLDRANGRTAGVSRRTAVRGGGTVAGRVAGRDFRQEAFRKASPEAERRFQDSLARDLNLASGES